MRDQLIAYLLGQSDLTVQDLEELLNNIFSPVLKRETMMTGTGFLAVAAREAADKATAAANTVAQREMLQAKTLTVMLGWNRGVSADIIIKLVDLSPNKIKDLMTAFDKAKSYYRSKADIDMNELQQLSGLTKADLKALLLLLQQNE